MLRPLLEELDKWAEEGLTATFWWRDDDAIEATPELDRLIEESTQAQAPLLLAVIPLKARSSLKDTLYKNEHIVIAQHGYAHINHAPRGQGLGAWEIGLHRGEHVVMDDLAKGFQILLSMFEDRFIPVVVPPWNRIDSGIFKPMADFGYLGVSAFGSLPSNEEDNDLIQVNCHCDPIKWKGGARFTGEEKSIAMICEHLKLRRTNKIQLNESTGLLTHHLDMDEPSWLFVHQLGKMLKAHPAAQWCDPKTLFNIKK